MKAKEGVVNILNKILTADLTAINQYFVHAKMCENWGYERLHYKVRERSIAEMKDADELIGHILYLDGVPNVQRMNAVQVGETVLEQLKLDLKAEQEMLTLLNDGVVHEGDRLHHAAYVRRYGEGCRCAHRLDRNADGNHQAGRVGKLPGGAD